MHGVQPDSLGAYEEEIWLIRQMNWSWGDLISAPKNFIEELSHILNCENKWESKKRDVGRQKAKQR